MATDLLPDGSADAAFNPTLTGAVRAVVVQGDVRVGLIITAVNIIGGLIIGMVMRGENFQTALKTYTLLTIGDGLVAQIPSLLITTATGMVVTRAGAKNNLTNELSTQMFQNSRALYITAGALFVASLVPGFPKISLWVISLFLGFIAYNMREQKKAESQKQEAIQEQQKVGSTERFLDELAVDPLKIEIGFNLVPLLDRKQGGTLLDRITNLRQKMASDLGMIVPPVRINDNLDLDGNEYIDYRLGYGPAILGHCHEAVDTAAREGANLIQFVGDAMATPLRDCLRAHPERWNLTHVVNLGSGGAVFSQHLKDDLKALVPSASITDGMGTSETGVSGMAEKSPDGLMRLPVNANQQVVVDSRLAQVGETGFVARTGNTPIGYYNDPVKTAETFVTIDGTLWAVAGDAARLDDDGMMTVFGRGSTCINTGGEKVFPEEVEEALRTHPAVFDAVVAGQPDERWGERVIGVVSPRPGVPRPDLAEVKAHLAPLLAGYKVPKALVWVDEIKRSPAGKQDYRWAKDMAGEAA